MNLHIKFFNVDAGEAGKLEGHLVALEKIIGCSSDVAMKMGLGVTVWKDGSNVASVYPRLNIDSWIFNLGEKTDSFRIIYSPGLQFVTVRVDSDMNYNFYCCPKDEVKHTG